MVNGKKVTGKKSHRIKSHKTSRKKSHRKKSHKKKSQETKSQYIFPHLLYTGKSQCIMSDFVHTQVMVLIATFKTVSVIWWLSVLSLQYISNLVSF